MSECEGLCYTEVCQNAKVFVILRYVRITPSQGKDLDSNSTINNIILDLRIVKSSPESWLALFNQNVGTDQDMSCLHSLPYVSQCFYTLCPCILSLITHPVSSYSLFMVSSSCVESLTLWTLGQIR